MRLTFGEKMFVAVTLVVAGLWLEFWIGHVWLPDGWYSQWYGLPLAYTFAAILGGLYAAPHWLFATLETHQLRMILKW